MRRLLAFFLFPIAMMTSCIFDDADFSAYTCTVEVQFGMADGSSQYAFGEVQFVNSLYPFAYQQASEADLRNWSETFWGANPGLRIEQETYRVDGVITGSAYKANQDSYQLPVPCE